MRLHRKTDPALFLMLPLAVYILVVIIPIISSVYYSFMDWNGITEMKYAGFSNFKKLFSDRNLITCFENNLKYSAVATVFQVGGGLVLAILLQYVKKGQNLLRVLLFTPTVISGMAMSQTFKKLLAISPDGVVNALLGAIGLSNLKTAFLADMDLTLYVVAIVESVRFCGLYMVVFHAAFSSIGKEIIEAAAIDGSTNWKTLIHIQLPMIKRTTINCVMLAIIGTLKAFEGPFVLTNSGLGWATELMSTYIYKTAFNSSNYGYASVLSLFLVVECIIAYGIINRITRQKEDAQ